MTSPSRTHLGSLFAGGALVLAGYLLGSLQPPRPAAAQTVVPGTFQFFSSGRPAILTTSDDGKTLHFWSTGLQPEVMNQAMIPQYVTSVRAGR